MDSLGILIRKSVRGKVGSDGEVSLMESRGQLEGGMDTGATPPGIPRLREAYANAAYSREADDDVSDARQRNKKKKRKNKKQESDEIPLRHVPKSAWNADPDEEQEEESDGEEEAEEEPEAETPEVETPEVETPEVNGTTAQEYPLYVPGDGDDLETLLGGIETNRKVVVECVEEWKRTEDRVAGKTAAAHAEVEKRRRLVSAALEEHSRRLHKGLDDRVEAFQVELKTTTDRLEEAIGAMDRVLEMRFHLNDGHAGLIRENLRTWLNEFEDLRAPVEVSLTPTGPKEGSLLDKLFGDIVDAESCSERGKTEQERGETEQERGKTEQERGKTERERGKTEQERGKTEKERGNTQKTAKRSAFQQSNLDGKPLPLPRNFVIGANAHLWSPTKKPGDRNKDKDRTSRYSDALRLRYGVLRSPLPVLTFSCRMSKDKRTCGVTDLVVTHDADDVTVVVVVDRNNKVLKVYDRAGRFQGYFGRDHLRKPSRASGLRHRRLAVTDDASACVTVFKADGQAVSRLSLLRHPVGHCQLGDGRLALLEFHDRSVAVIVDPEGGGGEAAVVRSFSTEMECPAYLASTASGGIVVTDWKSGTMKIFDSSTGLEKQRQRQRHRKTVPASTQPPSTSSSSSSPSREQQQPPSAEPKDLEEPYGVCCDGDGVVMVADRRRRAVVLFDEDGDVIWSYDDVTDDVGIPFAVDCDGRGVLAVGEYTGTVRMLRYRAHPDDGHHTEA